MINIVKVLLCIFLLTYSQLMYAACVSTGTINAVGIKINGGGSNSKINNTTEALAIHAAWLAAGSPASGSINGGVYNVSASGSNTVDRIDFGGSSHDFGGTLPYPGVGAGVIGSDFLVHTSGTLSLPAGDYTIFVESDDGFSFVMDTLSGDTVSFNKFGSSRDGGGNELRYERPTGNSNTGGSFTLTQDSVFEIMAIFFERGGGDYLEVSIANNIRTNRAPSGYEILREGALNGKVKFGDCAVEPIANFRFDEASWSGSAGEVIDEENSFNAQAINGANTENLTQAIVGNPGTCGYGTFDGNNDYIALPNTFENQQGDFTITAWINPTNLQAGSRVFADDENNSRGYAFSLGDPGSGKLRFYSRGVNPISVDTLSSVISTDTWTFVAAVHNRTTKTREIYVNGVAQKVTGGTTSNTYTGTWGVDTGIASIGGETNSGETNNRFTGKIDEVRFYKNALSASQIATIQNETHACATTSLSPVAEYRFEETTWDGSPDEILDNTGNGHHAQVLRDSILVNPAPATAPAAIPGDPGTCGYASQSSGSIQVTDLPLDTTTVYS